ncbi:MAG TPA: MOSC domain-containing protein [Solirubrobacteraceae bacterium]|jgi:hypothetical protein|nr:MOSC domain-containing protein [Solirubrobacteraceae bacterium]
MGITVGELWHHPVKSMQGERVDEVVLGPGGLVGDRAYGFLDLETERLVSAKHPKRYGAMLECRATFVHPPRVEEPTPPVRVTFPDGTTIDGDEEAIARCVSELLGREVRMVTSVPPGVPYEEVWPELEGFGPDEFYGMLQLSPGQKDEAGERIIGIPTGMAAPGTLVDFGAMHVLTSSTLDALAREHPAGDWDVRRFRPNILFAAEARGGGCVEDEWIGRDLQIGKQAQVHIVAPTPRCVMTTLPQGELGRDPGILRTVARANRRSLGPLGQFACAGAYAEVVTPGVVRTGDPVTVTDSIAQHSALGDAVEMILAGMRGGAA